MRKPVRHANKTGRPFLLGLIVNPIAGMGGPLGLKGTDGPAVREKVLLSSARLVAPDRAARALRRLADVAPQFSLLCAPGAMGADAARACGFNVTETGVAAAQTLAEHSTAAAAAMRAAGVDLLMFVGGDGTARDVLGGAPDSLVLGVPTGVKMHSAVFGASPEAAGNVARLVVCAGLERTQTRRVEVVDIDEEALRAGHLAVRLYGHAKVPMERQSMQNCKTPSRGDDAPALEALAGRIVRDMREGTLYVIGCGTTAGMIKRKLGFEGTLLGIDVVLNGRLLAADVDEARLLRLTQDTPSVVIVSVTGGQGYVFGRGNQQISPRLLSRIGRDNIVVITGASKLTALDPPCLRVDTGDVAVDAMLAGYLRVHIAPGRTMMMRVAA